MGSFAEKLDELGTPAWVALMVVSFVLFWPLGLLVLTYMAWSGRMKCWSRGAGRWAEKMEEHVQHHARRWHGGRSSGNAAFDEYREDTLRRLEEEEREFRSFLERLRHAKDKVEFDQFMAERRNSTPPATQQA